MTPPGAWQEHALVLGIDHPEYDRVAIEVLRGGATACAISAGSDPESPSLQFKGDRNIPNEDALLAIEAGPRTLLAVADAHFGHQSSHVLLQRLARTARAVPPNPLALLEAIAACARDDGANDNNSETTLLVAVWDRAARTGFGVSFGDSSLAVIARDRMLTFPRHENDCFVRPRDRATLDPRAAEEFSFRARDGELIVAHTDGIDGCHYGCPQTSVRPLDMQKILTRVGLRPTLLARELAELALRGVGGNPGGQDNVALIATTAE